MVYRFAHDSAGWLGGWLNTTDSVWRWPDGANIVWTDWGPSDYVPGAKTYLRLLRTDNKFTSDFPEHTRVSVFCEKEYGEGFYLLILRDFSLFVF